jgi:glyoxylase-like metal-dependent hydrolase (beta-lactamase superfamily II)
VQNFVSLHLLRVGRCRHLECMAARGGQFIAVDFPALCGLIRHPVRGWMLYDTGYADHFFKATQSWPECLYRAVTPVQLPPHENLVSQLKGHGVEPSEIRHIIISHYHGDHIAGLKDFPNANFIALQADTEKLKILQKNRLRATVAAHLHQLLPDNFYQRLNYADNYSCISLPSWMNPFEGGFDIFGDGSVLGVPLPGHSDGQLGLFLPNSDGKPVFLIGDACWSLPACKEGRLPSRLTRFLNANNRSYEETFFNLQKLLLRETAVSLLPSHCTHAWEKFSYGK